MSAKRAGGRAGCEEQQPPSQGYAINQYDAENNEENVFMESTQWGGTQQCEATCMEATSSSSRGGQPRHDPDVDVWGLLRQKGGDQEEFKLRHRMKDGRRDTYVIGRSVDCDIMLPGQPGVSNAHCRVYCDYSQARLRVFIEDCSTFGTFVNDSLTKLAKGERMELKSGDELFLVNPRLLQSQSNKNAKASGGNGGSNGNGKASVDVAASSFLFVNIRERVVANREKSLAPTNSQQAHNATTRHVEDMYVIGDQIGSGMCGTVHLCIERATGTHCAVKIIDTKKFALSPGLSPSDLREEAIMMMALDHPNIIRIRDTFETDNIIFIVMELVRGGDLFDRIVEKGRYTEDEARQVMQKVFSAVLYLHGKDIIHRDLKPENILLLEPHNDVEVKITDFGLAKRTNQEGLKTFCGTPQYFAPEVLKRKHTVAGVGSYGTAVDVWSLGVVLYILLSGAFPFDDDQLLDQIGKAHYSLSGVEWVHVSSSAKHLISSMMTLRPDQRLTVEQALAHPWMRNEPFPDKPSIGQFINSRSTTSSSAAFPEGHGNGAKGNKKIPPTGTGTSASTASVKRKNTGKIINRKSTSGRGSQGILQMLAAKTLKVEPNGALSQSNDVTATATGSSGKDQQMDKYQGKQNYNDQKMGAVGSMAVAAAYGSYFTSDQIAKEKAMMDALIRRQDSAASSSSSTLTTKESFYAQVISAPTSAPIPPAAVVPVAPVVNLARNVSVNGKRRIAPTLLPPTLYVHSNTATTAKTAISSVKTGVGAPSAAMSIPSPATSPIIQVKRLRSSPRAASTAAEAEATACTDAQQHVDVQLLESNNGMKLNSSAPSPLLGYDRNHTANAVTNGNGNSGNSVVSVFGAIRELAVDKSKFQVHDKDTDKGLRLGSSVNNSINVVKSATSSFSHAKSGVITKKKHIETRKSGSTGVVSSSNTGTTAQSRDSLASAWKRVVTVFGTSGDEKTTATATATASGTATGTATGTGTATASGTATGTAASKNMISMQVSCWGRGGGGDKGRKLRVAPKTIADLFKPREPIQEAVLEPKKE